MSCLSMGNDISKFHRIKVLLGLLNLGNQNPKLQACPTAEQTNTV